MSLISIYHWTPLFWEQDRLGMLVPALATPFRSPLANMLVQSGLTIFSGLAGFFLLGYLVAGRRRGLAIGAGSALLFLLAQREWRRFSYLVYIHQFATSMTLSLLALLLIDQWRRRRGGAWRWMLATVLFWLALWVNPACALAVGPLILLRAWFAKDSAQAFDREDGYVGLEDHAARRAWGLAASDGIAIAGVASGLALSLLISRFAGGERQEYRFLGLREWAACAIGVARDLPGQLDARWFWILLALAASGLAPLAWPAGRRALGVSLGVALSLTGGAAVQYAFVTSLDHVHRTDFGHYAFGAVFLWQGACIAFCVLQWSAITPATSRFARGAPWALLAALAVVAAARHGRPGLDVVRRSLAEGIGRYTPEVLAARATHVTGGYTDVWVTVFHANMLLAERGSPYTVWGIANRAQPTADRWTAVPWAETRIAEISSEHAAAEVMLARYGVPPVELVEELPSIRVLRPTAPLSSSRVTMSRR
jgi:hypothetical protein